MERVYNFSPGPSQLPLPVLEKAQKDLLCYGDTGMSVMEMSHRSKMYTDIYTKEILLLTTEEEMVETPRGIRVGSTKHKVIKEYGQPQKATKNGMVCFIYQMGGKRIIFDVTAGHVEAIMINCMPSATMTLEGE